MLLILKYLFGSDGTVFIIIANLYVGHLSFYSTPKDCVELLKRKSSPSCPFLHTGHTWPKKVGEPQIYGQRLSPSVNLFWLLQFPSVRLRGKL